jgi:hypothetical protein
MIFSNFCLNKISVVCAALVFLLLTNSAVTATDNTKSSILECGEHVSNGRPSFKKSVSFQYDKVLFAPIKWNKKSDTVCLEVKPIDNHPAIVGTPSNGTWQLVLKYDRDNKFTGAILNSKGRPIRRCQLSVSGPDTSLMMKYLDDSKTSYEQEFGELENAHRLEKWGSATFTGAYDWNQLGLPINCGIEPSPSNADRSSIADAEPVDNKPASAPANTRVTSIPEQKTQKQSIGSPLGQAENGKSKSKASMEKRKVASEEQPVKAQADNNNSDPTPPLTVEDPSSGEKTIAESDSSDEETPKWKHYLNRVHEFTENLFKRDPDRLPGVFLFGSSVSLEDFNRFGWEYIGKNIVLTGRLYDAYSCNAPSNKGYICGRVSFVEETTVVFDSGLGSKEIKPHLGTCVFLSGFVEERDEISIFGATKKTPSLIVEDIRTARGKGLEDCESNTF